MAADYALIADIGGTHVRFATVDDQYQILHPLVLRGRDYESLWDAYQAYRAQLPSDVIFTKAALAVAGPVTGDLVRITNRDWSFSQQELQHALGVSDFVVMNDFKALALSLPHLGADEKEALYTPKQNSTERAPLLVIGPGTGLGVATLVPVPGGGWLPVPGEGGHVMLPAHNPDEEQIIAGLAQEFDYVSAERVLSGQGLLNIYRVMADDEGLPVRYNTPEALAEGAQQGDDLAQQALEQFCAFLGNVAGDAALTAGAVGGIYLAGGILPHMKDVLQQSEFLQRIHRRDVVASYMKAIPVWLITAPLPAFVGLKHFWDDGKE
jgi:glucokinase